MIKEKLLRLKSGYQANLCEIPKYYESMKMENCLYRLVPATRKIRKSLSYSHGEITYQVRLARQVIILF